MDSVGCLPSMMMVTLDFFESCALPLMKMIAMVNYRTKHLSWSNTHIVEGDCVRDVAVVRLEAVAAGRSI
jgi:hypothetical protein